MSPSAVDLTERILGDIRDALEHKDGGLEEMLARLVKVESAVVELVRLQRTAGRGGEKHEGSAE